MPYPPYNPWVFRKADARLAQYVKDGAGKTRVDVRVGPVGTLRLKPVAPHGLLGQARAVARHDAPKIDVWMCCVRGGSGVKGIEARVHHMLCSESPAMRAFARRKSRVRVVFTTRE